MTTMLRRATLAAVLLLPAALAAQSPDFTWNGTVGKDRWLYLRDMNGSVTVEQGTGDKVEVTAIKKASHGGDPDVVKIVAKQDVNGGDAIVCALWDEQGTCDVDEYRAKRRSGWRDGDDDRYNVSVEFRVRLPAGVRLDASTVNGRVSIAGATSEVKASTVNGGIVAASSGGPVRASTVNGSIDVRMGQLGSEPLEYSTVNGSVTVRVPAALNADVELSTVNGSIESNDFPLTVQGRIDRRHVRARIGNGGQRMKFSTVNGSVQLLRS